MRLRGLFAAGLIVMATQSVAQDLTRETRVQLPDGQIMALGDYCDDATTADSEICLSLLVPAGSAGALPVTNFAPVAAGLTGLGLLLAATGGGTSTPSTTD